MNTWPKVMLGSIAQFANGINFTKESFGHGLPLLGVRNFEDRFVPDWTKADEIVGDTIVPDRQLLADGDLLFVRSNGNRDLVGRCLYIEHPPRSTHSGFTIRARPDRSKVVPRFLAYQMRHAHRSGLMASANGTNITNLNQALLSRIPVFLPEIDTQLRVVDVLGALDSLIENDRRRIELLEQAAQVIYREWFVHFRYPGYEHDELAQSQFGAVPSSWDITDVGGACAYLNRGVAPKYAEDGAYLVINQKCIRSGRLSLERSRRQSRPVDEKRLVRFGDVLINSTGVGTLGRVAQVYRELDCTTVDTHVTIARPRNGLDVDWFGLSLLGLQSIFEAQGVGSTGQTELSRNAISQESLVLPPINLQRRFGDIIRPLRRLGSELAERTKVAVSMRDSLLPKLVTGEIDLSTIDLDMLTCIRLRWRRLGESGAVLRG